MPELAVSSWSLHRTLGPVYRGLAPTGPRPAATPYGPGTATLLDLPALLTRLGIPNLEICHFHLPRTDGDYLATVRGHLIEAGVRPLTLLVDAGDIAAADPEARQRDLEGIKGWIDIATRLGATYVRVVAGETPPDPAGEAIGRAVAGLRALADYARPRGVTVITENWRPLALAPATLLTILDRLDGAVGLCADFGNYAGATKYDDLRAILPRAVTIHAKAQVPTPGAIDADDYRTCLDLARAAGFAGAYVLIFDGPGDEWAGLAQLTALVRPYLS